ncbi:sterile alpha motif domain-containing protein 13 [Dasypus novemcinctus]|uniref:sterile alpha motif domain-containing protein 13 n=1 Tax=Dasypus novemcinctus TaxID=9361 RepID=UPI0039C90B56
MKKSIITAACLPASPQWDRCSRGLLRSRAWNLPPRSGTGGRSRGLRGLRRRACRTGPRSLPFLPETAPSVAGHTGEAFGSRPGCGSARLPSGPAPALRPAPAPPGRSSLPFGRGEPGPALRATFSRFHLQPRDPVAEVKEPCRLPMLSVDMENKENGSVGVKNSMENGRPPDPADWAVVDVVNYFRTAGFEEQASAFQEQEIDGKSLLLMTRNDVLTGLQLKLGPALKIYEYHVKPLQTKHLKNNSS